MNDDLYSGEIDWERIYKTFHDPSQISNRIQKELGGTNMPIVFSGFIETASHLANEMPVTFVDYSPSITDAARRTHKKLHEIHTGDITELIGILPIPRIVVACRISAYWDSPEYFKRLSTSLLSFHREIVLIDFFDRDLVKLGAKLCFKNKSDIGNWEFLYFEEINVGAPSFFKSKLRVSYSLSDYSFNYDGYRSFFTKTAILRWANSMFTDYDVIMEEPLLDQDPSFVLKLVRKKG
nr:hypothetical protein [uncultured Desulfobacter sp.]